MHAPRLSIASVVTAGIVAATTLLLGALGYVGYGFFCDRERADFQNEHAILADQLATSLTLPLWNFDREQIGKILDGTAPDQDVYGVEVRSVGAAPTIYARVRDGNWRLLAAPALAGGEMAHVEQRDIAAGGNTIGQMRVAVTTRFLERRLQHALWSIVGAICALDSILVVGLYLLLWRTVLRPLREVERYAVAVSSSDAAAGGLRGQKYLGELETLRGATEKMVGLLEARYADLQKSEARYRLLAENIGDVIWTLDLAGNVTYVSPSVERLLGYAPEEAVRMSLEQLLTPASAAKLRQLIGEIVAAAAAGGPIAAGRVELENIDRNGARKWAENTYELLHGPGGELVGILGVCRDMTERRAAEAVRERALVREQEARREFTRKLIASQEEERRRIASELHDSLGQNLLLIKNRAQLALAQPGSPADGLGERMQGIAELASQAIAEVRQISHDLRPYQLDQLGLTRALQAMIDQAAESTAIVFKCRLENVDADLRGDDATELYRVVQEALNNILKHSGASQVRIELERDVHHVRLWIEDNGHGFDDRARAVTGVAGGFGLQNIAERVNILGGTFTVESAPGAGARLEVIIRIPERGEPRS